MTDKYETATFGESLKHHRKKCDLSRDKLAELMGTNKAQIWRIETGKTNPRLDTIMKICDILQVSVSQLLTNPQNNTEEIVEDKDFFELYQSKSSDTKRKIRIFSDWV